MKLFEELTLQFEDTNWASNPEFGVMDAVLEKHPELILMMKDDITNGEEEKQFGRKDTPSVEQIVRFGLFKELRGLDYRSLELAQEDSRICEKFVKINHEEPYSFQVLQKYISRIKEKTLNKLLVEINKIAIAEGLEDLEDFRQDSTVIETNIHYPTNNSLVWDCVREAQRLLKHLQEEAAGLEAKDYAKGAKKTHFKINNTRNAEKRVKLFIKQLVLFAKSIDQVSRVVKKNWAGESLKAWGYISQLEALLPLMEKVYRMTELKEIVGVGVPVGHKLFSIYELHTDLIVKGNRKVQFGHKVNLGTGKSNMILTCEVVSGNPSDKELYQPAVEKVIEEYKKVPKSSVTDGGFASLKNLEYAKGKGIINIVFNKIVGSLRNIATSKRIENKLKRWRSGMEAVISNLKRGFNIRRCFWKNFEHYKQKVLWSVIGYNIRVMSGLLVANMQTL